MTFDDFLSWIPELFGLYAAPLVFCAPYAYVGVSLRRQYGNLVLALFTLVAIIALSIIAPLVSPESEYLGRIPGVRTTLIVIGFSAAAVVIGVRARKGRSASATTVHHEVAWAVAGFIISAILPVQFLLLLIMLPSH